MLGLIFIGGREARRKAKRFGNDFIRRAERLLEREGFGPLRDVDIEILGSESTYGPHSRAVGAREVVVKIGLHHDTREALSAIVRELGSFGMAVPGLTAGGRGLPKPTPLVRLKSYLIPRDRFHPTVHLDGSTLDYEEPTPPRPVQPPEIPETIAQPMKPGDSVELPLIAIAHARSGDKGADANIGVRARHPDFVPFLRAELTAARVAEWLGHRIEGAVYRYEAPGIHAFNFVLRDALGGGGISSLRFDPQGKAYAQQLLDIPLRMPAIWLAHPALMEAPEVESARSSASAGERSPEREA